MRNILLCTVLFCTHAFAWDDPRIGDPYLSTDKGYKSQTGTKYQYDLSRPVDQIKYEVDIKAQMRDENSLSVTRELDRDLGQVGGGIYD